MDRTNSPSNIKNKVNGLPAPHKLKVCEVLADLPSNISYRDVKGVMSEINNLFSKCGFIILIKKQEKTKTNVKNK